MARIIAKKLTHAGVLIILAGLLVSAWGLLKPDWILLSFGLSITFLPLGSALIAFMTANTLAQSIVRVIPSIPVEGQVVPVILEVNNSGRIPLVIVEAEDTPPKGIHAITDTRISLIAPPNGLVDNHYFLVARSGKRRFGQLQATIQDPLGLYSLTMIIEPKGEAYLQAKPRIEKGEVREIAEQEMVALVRRLTRGPGLEFYEVREYQEGDDPRLIDWKATARLGKLIVKEMRKESSSPVILILAPGPWGDEGPSYKTPFEKAARIAAGITDVLSAKNVNIGYIGLTMEPVLIPPGTGPRARLSVIFGIASTPPSSSIPSSLGSIVREFLYDYVRARPLLVLISDKRIVSDLIEDLEKVAWEVKGKVVTIGV